MHKLNTEYLIAKINELGYFLDGFDYKNSHTKFTVYDKEGYFYYTTFYQLQHLKRGKFYKTNPYTIQNIKLWCKLNNKQFELLSDEYIGVFDKLKWRCLKETCKEEFFANWSDIQSGYGCGVCYGRQTTLLNCLATKRPDLAKEWHPIKNGDLTPLDITEFSNKRVWWKCENGHEWDDKISNRSRYVECPYCNHQRPSKDYNLLIVNLELCKEWSYDKNKKNPEEYLPNSNKKVWWICRECGHEWKTSICGRNGIDGSGCPKCNESKGEKRIKSFLDRFNMYYDIQYKIDKCRNKRKLPFDFVIFEDKEKIKLRMLIEYDGILHYEDKFNNPSNFQLIQKNDKIKDEYCNRNNIKLLRIPYWNYDNIEGILVEELII